MEAACSEDPSAMDWLAEETWPDADATWSAPSYIPVVMALIGLLMERTINHAITKIARTLITEIMLISLLIAFTAAKASDSSISAIKAQVVSPTFKGVNAESTGFPL